MPVVLCSAISTIHEMISLFMQVKISGEVICRMGSLLLSSKNTTPLGGEVESLKEENSVWNLLHRAM